MPYNWAMEWRYGRNIVILGNINIIIIEVNGEVITSIYIFVSNYITLKDEYI